MGDSADVGVVDYLFEIGALKRLSRTGWAFANVANPESIADHSHRTAVIGAMLAVAEGADPARTSLMCTFHDTQETRIGDIPHSARPFLNRAVDNQGITTTQLADVPDPLAEYLSAVVDEYEQQETIEAIVAKDADKLECLIQALEYATIGHNTDRWIHSSLGRLKTDTARRWAGTAINHNPQHWLKQ